MMGETPFLQAGKENRNNFDFETEASGKPTSSNGSESYPDKRQVRRYITIKDGEIWELIDRIMLLPEYQKSFNKVINHALKFGIVELYEKLFLKEKQTSAKEIEELNVANIQKSPREKQIEDYLMELGYSMKENVVYLTIIKSIVCSLFNGRLLEIGGQPIPQQKYGDGAYRMTPEYLEAYENRAFKNIREDD